MVRTRASGHKPFAAVPSALSMAGSLLPIYLQDHLAGATAGVALAKRVAHSNSATHAGPALARVAAEIEADRATLEGLMAELGIRPSRPKSAAVWLGERLARLKPSGRPRAGKRYHQLHELETLSLGIAGKLALWQALEQAKLGAPVDLGVLAERAARQREQVEAQRLALARVTFRA